ncbi:DUF1566 domain-containing protein [Cysteiniphilum halobium]|uniref:Lcl C-terminal domain-containing protein n=1 Tax=Cysteiniphilum halobium TaxID=2219059 RepID=UPI003F857F3E
MKRMKAKKTMRIMTLRNVLSGNTITNRAYLWFGLMTIMSIINYDLASATAVIQDVGPGGSGAGKWPYPRFIEANGQDGKPCADALYDKLTGLMWAKDGADSGLKNWSDAKTYTAGLSLCGYSDWSLPTINELRSLINYSFAGTPAGWLNANSFTRVQLDEGYWSGTVYSFSSEGSSYLSVTMKDGDMRSNSEQGTYHVLPVRKSIDT